MISLVHGPDTSEYVPPPDFLCYQNDLQKLTKCLAKLKEKQSVLEFLPHPFCPLGRTLVSEKQGVPLEVKYSCHWQL